MRFLVDMNLSPNWVEFFVTAGFEAIHWSDIGPGSAPDSDLMRWAAEHGHIVVTNDLDFGAILAASQRRQPSVVQIRSELLTPAAVGRVVLAAIAQAEAECAPAHCSQSMPLAAVCVSSRCMAKGVNAC